MDRIINHELSGNGEFGKPSKRNFARAHAGQDSDRTAASNFKNISAQAQISQNIENVQNNLQQTQASTYQYALTDTNAHTHTETTPQTEETYTFGDVLDIINPLHHIPIVGSLYRTISGDEIKPAAQIIGSGLYSGPIGASVAVANTVIEHETGRDVTGNAIALVSGQGIEKINHDKIVFNYPIDFDEGARTHPTQSVRSENQKIFNFNLASNAYESRQNYAARYNS